MFSGEKAALGGGMGAGSPVRKLLQLSKREMVMACSHDLKLEEVRSGGFWKYSEVMMDIFADGLRCVVRTREGSCFDLSQTSSTIYQHGQLGRKSRSGDED